MKYKRVGALSLLCAVLMFGCVGCTDTYDGKIACPQWGGNLKSHWYMDADGAVTQKGKHTLENEECTVCGATVSYLDNGTKTASFPNDYGDVVVFLSYDKNGRLSWDTYNYYEYDDKGNLALQITYDGDRLQEEITYQMHRIEQVPCALVSTFYDESGMVEELTYNDVGEIVQMVTRDADGQTIRTERYDREYGEDNQLRRETIYVDDVLTTERVYVPDDGGFFYIGEEITYNPDGAVDSVTKYDVEGNVIE